jgi:GeoRSP system SPASM domain protein
MGLELLDTPVRLSWDLPAVSGGREGINLASIAASIVDGGVFFVTLQGAPLLRPDLTEVLELLSGACQLLVDCRGSQEELARLELLPQSGCQLLLDVSGFIDADPGVDDDTTGVDKDALRGVVHTIRHSGFEPVLTLIPSPKNLVNIPDLLRFCVECQTPKFKLPNAHIGDSFDEYSSTDLPRWQDLENFKRIWLEFIKRAPALPALEIHDLFLWEIMTPGQQQNRSEYGGCQAGNSLGHIDCHGVVHPCAAWPRQLGKLPAQSLEEIWAGPERMSVRERVALTPQGCLGCRDLGSCFGGCRGLACHLNSSEGERDLMCSGPR